MPLLSGISISNHERPFHVRQDASMLGATSTITLPSLVERVNVPFNTKFGATNPPGLVEAMTVDPWSNSGKYALGWLYFCIILLVATILTRIYAIWRDKIRTATYKDELLKTSVQHPWTGEGYEMGPLNTDTSSSKLFPRLDRSEQWQHDSQEQQRQEQQQVEGLNSPSTSFFSKLFALFRLVFYRPPPSLSLGKRLKPIALPDLSVCFIVLAALAFTILYTFIPQPLYWQSLAYGSPPVAIRSGMLAVAMMPWIIALSMKANIVSLVTGIGHERLNVLHRWGGWICLLLSLIHTVPFYVAKFNDPAGYAYYRTLLNTPSGVYLFGTGFAALAPLIFLCLHGIHHLRHWMYEMFVLLHAPASIVYVAMLIWHCNNYLTSWNYLWASLSIWGTSYAIRFSCLNWTNPWRISSFFVGDEAGVLLLPENAVKITIPTRMKWRPGQYVYLRMPGISIFDSHPFTITSLCSDDFPSEYGENYRDMVLVFRPFGGFTRKVVEMAKQRGPWHPYRAFLDGPYGGMRRSLEAFDHVILLAGGSGITALTSHLLDLIKRMRDGKAVTKRIQIIWALKRPETMDWFREELRIAREFAPPDSVQCHFYITAAKRLAAGQLVSATTPGRPLSRHFNDKLSDVFQHIANKRSSHYSEVSRHSAMIQDEAKGNPDKENELRAEQLDKVAPLPQATLVSAGRSPISPAETHKLLGTHVQELPSHLPRPLGVQKPYLERHDRNIALSEQQQQQQHETNSQTSSVEEREEIESEIQQPKPSYPQQGRREQQKLTVDIEQAIRSKHVPEQTDYHGGFDFGFPSTPTEFQKSLMRFAFLPAALKRQDGWSIEYGRPDIPYMLRHASKQFGRRTCVFVCGPSSMRRDVCRTVAELQVEVLGHGGMEEIYLHTENYAL